MSCVQFSREMMLAGVVPVVVLLVALSTAFAAEAGELLRPNETSDERVPIVVGDLLRLRTITEVIVAPDASFAVYAVKEIHEKHDAKEKPKGEYEYRTHLWRTDLDDSNAQPVQLTFGQRTASDPAISPDGAWLAFSRTEEVDDDKADKKSQVWLLPMNGPGEARQITYLEDGASNPVWHPGGRSLLVSSSIPFSKIEGFPEWELERPGLSADTVASLKKQITDAKKQESAQDDTQSNGRNESNHKPKREVPGNDLAAVREWLNRNASDTEKPNPNVINRVHFQDEHALAGEMKFSHLFRVNLDDKTGDGYPKSEQLTDGFNNHGAPQYSPDGSLIAFVDKPRGPLHPDRYYRSCIFLMNADGTNVRKIAGDEKRTFGQPRFSPTGNSVVATTQPTEEMWYQQPNVARISLDGSGFEMLSQDWPSAADTLRVSKTDGSIVFSTRWHGAFPLRRVTGANDTAPSTVEIEATSNLGVHAFDVANGTIVAAVTNVEHPVRLIAIDVATGRERVLHDLNPWIASKRISIPEERRIGRPDGTRVQYWVMEPTPEARMSRNSKAPTVLEIHGGPASMWGPGELTMWHEYQLLCSWGYGVVYSNPRGSSGYGYDFQRRNHQNWGVGPTGDVLAALDDAVSKDDWIDTDNLFVTGGSYAGYLTAWIVGHDHRFNAAVAQRGVYDLDTFFGEGNAWILVPWAMGGYPWEEEIDQVLERESPFSYVHEITTPLMIMHSSQDLRTGVSQSEMMYRALKELNREVEYIRYPGAGHDLSRTGDAKQRIDRLLRIVEFFERYKTDE